MVWMVERNTGQGTSKWFSESLSAINQPQCLQINHFFGSVFLSEKEGSAIISNFSQV